MVSNDEVKELIDEHFSLQWCKDNVIVPLGIRSDPIREKRSLIIAVANISYLGTVGNFLIERFSEIDLPCLFIEIKVEEINKLLEAISQ